ncbi:MAG: hypothetical protein LAT50_14905 [Ectothiorhodospiraceae bacterium]|nr:hypothetical protein [Ectothiorhodospiraceae bacterium]
MHAWEGLEVADAVAAIAERDPRKYRFGLASASSGTADSGGLALRWFGTVGELNQFALRVEPRCRGLAMAELINFKQALGPVSAAVDVQGLTEALREQYHAFSEPAFRILWWGSLEQLRQAGHPWTRELVAAYRQQPGASAPQPVRSAETADFVAYLQQHFGG